MSKLRRNDYQWALIETPFGHNGWVTNPEGFSLHMDDNVILKSKDSIFEGRIIRRTNEKQEWYIWTDTSIIATANQFPESGLPTQPELPVVPVSFVSLRNSQNRIDDAKSYLKNALEQLEKI